MKIENTPEWKARFFALYWGHRVARVNPFIGKVFPSIFLQYYDSDVNEAEEIRNTSFLELRPLSDITDEEAIEYACIKDREYKGGRVERRGKAWVSVVRKLSKESNVSINIPFQCTDIYSNGEQVDYLRSCGFALPYMGVLVGTLIEWGWVKLKGGAE